MTPAEKEAAVRESCRTLDGQEGGECQYRDALLAMLDMETDTDSTDYAGGQRDFRDYIVEAAYAAICTEEK